MNNDKHLVKSLEDSLKTLTNEKTTTIEKKGKNYDEKIQQKTLYETEEEAIRQKVLDQDYKIREKYINAVEKDIESKTRIRKIFLIFYLIFISVVTFLIFFVIIDPVTLFRGKDYTYQNSLKLALVGVFFANLISIALVMVKYSFAPIDNVIKAFEKLSKDNGNE